MNFGVHITQNLYINGKVWMWEIPGSEVHHASHPTINCSQITHSCSNPRCRFLPHFQGKQRPAMTRSPIYGWCDRTPDFPPFYLLLYSSPDLSGLRLTWANNCANRMTRTPGGNIGKYTGEECATAWATSRPLPMRSVQRYQHFH